MIYNRDKLIATLILTGFFIFTYIHYFRFWNTSRPEIPEKLEVFGQVPSFEGFRYFSGYYNNLNYNYLIVYAYSNPKSNYRKMLRIVGHGV